MDDAVELRTRLRRCKTSLLAETVVGRGVAEDVAPPGDAARVCHYAENVATLGEGAKQRRSDMRRAHPLAGWPATLVANPALALAPLLVFLVVVSVVFPDRQDDEAGYLELARNLMHGHYATGRPNALLDADPSYPDLWFGPGLPLALVGPVAAGLSLTVMRLVGPLFLFAALVVFFKLMRRTVAPGAALVVTWLLGLYLPFYTVLPNLHSEPLAVLFVALALYATARIVEGADYRWVAVGGVALAGLALTRVDYGWVVTAVLIALVVWSLFSRSRRAPRRLASMYALGLALCIPWLVYTHSQTGRVFLWGNSGSLSLYWMSTPYPHEYGDWQQANAVFSDPNLSRHKPFFTTLEGHTLSQQNATLEHQAVDNIRHHPAKYLENVAANVSRMLFDTPYSYTPQRLGALYFALPNALLFGVFVLAAVVAVRMRASLPPPTLPFALFAFASFAMHALLAAYPRMLIPIAPVVAWFVGTTFGRNVRLVGAGPQGDG